MKVFNSYVGRTLKRKIWSDDTIEQMVAYLYGACDFCEDEEYAWLCAMYDAALELESR